jgi:predicted HAD superfamily phosphohydrolase
MDSGSGFHVWQETEATAGKSHALWIAEPMVRHLSAEQLVNVLNNEGMAEEIRISFKMRIQERGDGYRVSIVSRRSGEWRRQE